MGKSILKNVRMGGTNFGSVKNYDHVEMENVEMNFTESGMNISIDPDVAIVKDALKAGISPERLSEIIKELKFAEPGEREKIAKKSELGKLLKGIKDWGPIVVQLLSLARE